MTTSNMENNLAYRSRARNAEQLPGRPPGGMGVLPSPDTVRRTIPAAAAAGGPYATAGTISDIAQPFQYSEVLYTSSPTSEQRSPYPPVKDSIPVSERRCVVAICIFNVVVTVVLVSFSAGYLTYRHYNTPNVTTADGDSGRWPAGTRLPAVSLVLSSTPGGCNGTEPERITGWGSDDRNFAIGFYRDNSSVKVNISGHYVIYTKLAFACPKKTNTADQNVQKVVIQRSTKIIVHQNIDIRPLSSYCTGCAESCYNSLILFSVWLEVDDLVYVNTTYACLLVRNDGRTTFGIFRIDS